jgi:Rps23 Pro-64 3,4-dihydroxylase Tpa1-like proline 4-hydroxylase
MEGFLSRSDHSHLLRLVALYKDCFTASTTTTKAPGFRNSLVLYSLPEIFPLLTELIDSCVPVVTRSLGLRDFIPSSIEMQLTAHRAGGFFKKHRDNTDHATARRLISYAYYFHQEPKLFRGGELVLFGRDDSIGQGKKRDRKHVIKPRDNTIVFFRSEQSHEIRQVSCESNVLDFCRLTVNGWIKR